MKKILKFLKNNPHVAIGMISLLCFMQFLTSIFHILIARDNDKYAMTQLLSSVDGLEAVILFLITLALQDKKK